MLPFVGTLLCIALLPLFAGHWWEHNRNKGIIAALFAVPVAVYLALAFGRDGAHDRASLAGGCCGGGARAAWRQPQSEVGRRLR